MDHLSDQAYEMPPETLDFVDTIALDSLTSTSPSPATIPHTHKLSFATDRPRRSAELRREERAAYLERQHTEGFVDTDIPPRHEIPDALNQALVDTVGNDTIRTEEIIIRLFGVPIIHPETFTVIHAALRQLVGNETLIKDKRNFYRLRQAPETANFIASEDLADRIHEAGIPSSPSKVPASSINHRTGRSGVRRHK